MSDNKKARPGEDTPEQAHGLNEAAEETTSISYSSIARKHGQDVSAALGRGRENGLKARQIQAQYGYTPREIRLIVNYERTVNGQLICGNRFGYYFGDDSEILSNIRSLRKMAASDMAVADAMERALRKRQGQQVMSEWE